MNNIKIQIPDMQSAHCQMRVRNALNSLDGVVINDLQAGMADVTIHDGTKQEEVLDIIQKAGYSPIPVRPEHDEPEDGKTFHFKTNINCRGCVAQVTPELNAAEGVCHWDVDLQSKDRILSVHSDGITEEEVMKAVRKAGFDIELLTD